jgi:hypothetical protein
MVVRNALWLVNMLIKFNFRCLLRESSSTNAVRHLSLRKAVGLYRDADKVQKELSEEVCHKDPCK